MSREFDHIDGIPRAETPGRKSRYSSPGDDSQVKSLVKMLQDSFGAKGGIEHILAALAHQDQEKGLSPIPTMTIHALKYALRFRDVFYGYAARHGLDPVALREEHFPRTASGSGADGPGVVE